MARALADARPPVARVALKRADGPSDADDATRFPVEEGARALRAFVRRPFAALWLLASAVARAVGGNKEGGRAGAVLAWRDGLRLADWARRTPGVVRFHAQFASWEATAALVAARLGRTRFSFELHNPYTLVKGRALLGWKLRAADVVTAISDDVRRRAVALAPGVAARIALVRCGLDFRDVPPRRDGGPDVVAVGSLVPRKGHDVLVRGLARIAAARPGFSAVIVGEGPERTRLEALAAQTGAPVRLVGALPETEAWALAASARVAALACVTADDGDEDGIPVALLEAMAAGTPVVSTPVGGIAELLEDGEAGLLVPPRDPVALAAAIERLLDDEALRARLVARGRRAVAARHDVRACARDLATAFDRAAGPASSA